MAHVPPPYVPDADDDDGERSGQGPTPAGRAAGEDAEREPSRARPDPPTGAAAEVREGPEQLAGAVEEALRDVPDFPRPGILFRDVAPVFADADLFRRITRCLAAEAARRRAERVVGIESRGFLLGAPVALSLGLPFVPVRKGGKLPGPTRSVEYELEYGTGHLEIQTDAVSAGERVVIVDDLLATGGTAAAAAGLVEELDGVVAGIAFLVELSELEGRTSLGRYNFFSILRL